MTTLAAQESTMRDPNHVTTHAEALAYHARQLEWDARIDKWNAEYDAKQREVAAATAHPHAKAAT